MRPVQMMGISKHNTERQRQGVDRSIAREPSMPSRPTRNSVCPLHIHMTAHPGLPRGPNVITKVLLSERWREETQRELGDAVLPAWKVEEGPRVKERRQTSKSWKRQSFSSGASRRNTALPTP